MSSHSSEVRGPALSRTRSETPILPMSCRKATFSHLLEALLGPAQLATEHGHVGGHAAGVAERVVVLGAEGRAEGAQVAEVEALHLLVELGVLERQGHRRADRFGDGDLLRA